MNEMQPSISVIIPAMGFPQLFTKVMEALLLQTLLPKEIVVVDSSKDDSILKLVEYFKTKIKIRVIKVSKAYPGEARNIGVRNAKNNLIAFLDSKTIPTVDWLSKAVEIINKESYDIIFGTTTYAADSSKQKILQACVYGKNPVITTPGTVLNKNVFNAIGEFTEGVRSGEDLEWRNRAEALSLKIYKPQGSLLDYPEISKTYLNEVKKHFIYQFHGAKLDVQHNSRIVILGLSLFFITLIIPKWNAIVGWNESIFYIPHITKSYFYMISVFSLFILGMSKFFKLNNLWKKYFIAITFIICFNIVYQWNYVIALWVEEFIFIPHITKIYIAFLAISSLFFRGIYKPLSMGIDRGFIFPFKWLWVGIIGMFLDIVKVPGYFLGAIIALKRRLI